MNKKIALVSAILGLTFSLCLLAQAPASERTKPTQHVIEGSPFGDRCWEVAEPTDTCFEQVLAWYTLRPVNESEEKQAWREILLQVINKKFADDPKRMKELKVLLSLESEKQSIEQPTTQSFTQLPTIQQQKELVSRAVQTEDQPPATTTSFCWEDTRPSDPIDCLAQIEKRIVWLKAEKTKWNKKQIDRDIKLLNVDKKRIKKQFRYRIRVARAQEKREEREMSAINRADIFCPDPRRREEVEILNTNHFNFNRFQAFNRVTITNPFDFPLRIRASDPNQNSSGDIANLPGGCTITASRSIKPLLETSGYNSLNYWYTAYALNPQDQRGVARSQTFSLFPGNSFQQMSVYTWVVGNFQLNSY